VRFGVCVARGECGWFVGGIVILCLHCKMFFLHVKLPARDGVGSISDQARYLTTEHY